MSGLKRPQANEWLVCQLPFESDCALCALQYCSIATLLHHCITTWPHWSSVLVKWSKLKRDLNINSSNKVLMISNGNFNIKNYCNEILPSNFESVSIEIVVTLAHNSQMITKIVSVLISKFKRETSTMTLIMPV